MKTNINKIWFTGSHGTGKTTQMEYFHQIHPEFGKMKMERRDLHKQGIIKLNKDAAPWDEVVIAGSVMLAILATASPFISDRSWVCKCAYSQALPFRQEILDAFHTLYTDAFPGMNEATEKYFYFPPTIGLENDGVRSTDVEYQKEIDLNVQFYLNFFGIPYHTITASTIQDRNFEIEREVFKK
jgi:hypothetical protein